MGSDGQASASACCPQVVARAPEYVAHAALGSTHLGWLKLQKLVFQGLLQVGGDGGCLGAEHVEGAGSRARHGCRLQPTDARAVPCMGRDKGRKPQGVHICREARARCPPALHPLLPPPPALPTGRRGSLAVAFERTGDLGVAPPAPRGCPRR